MHKTEIHPQHFFEVESAGSPLFLLLAGRCRMTAADPELLERIARFVDRLVEGRDPDLAGHNKRTGNTTLALFQRIGCSAEELRIVTAASELHDLGKMSISEHLLNKPARLTKTEFELVKQHTVIGGHLIEPLGLDSRIHEVIVSHHENFDGSGYPRGLRSEDIPFLARGMRITDSYDALTADRPYHKGVSSNEALSILFKDAHFYDPHMLKSFEQVLKIA